MKTILILITLIFLLPGTMSAKKKDYLINISGHKISKEEFERIYKKNNQALTEESELKSPTEYLELYINFKLKVIEAMDLGMDTLQSFKDELAGYRTELAAPYLTDMKYDDKLVHELYDRMKKEVNASHILFRVNPEADYKQEEAVREKALQVRQEIMNGRDFNDAAQEYSEDPSARMNQGKLGYFTAFQMVTPFENHAFNTPEGEVSEPVRTTFGYHLIKVHDIRENKGEIKVAHIMKMFPRDAAFDKEALRAEIDSVYQLLLRGVPFEELVKKYSDDKRSVPQNGEMPWFSAGQMIPEFAQPAFSLNETGDFTEPVETPFGFHIIRKMGQKPVPPLETIRHEIEDKIKRDPLRSNSTRKAFVEKLKQEYGFEEAETNINLKELPIPEEAANRNQLLFTFGSQSFFMNDYLQYLSVNSIQNGRVNNPYDDWVEYEILRIEDSKLEEKHPEFRLLMQEYHDGLLFFNIMEEKIWNHAAEDSIGLKDFYSENRDLFMWEERFRGLIITCKDSATREEAEKYFDAGLSQLEVEDLLNAAGKKIEIQQGAWEEGTNPAVDYYIWNGTVKQGFNPQNTFLKGNVIGPEPKTLEEAKGLYISAYQDYLEKNWIKELRRKYKIKVRKRLLKTVPHV